MPNRGADDDHDDERARHEAITNLHVLPPGPIGTDAL